MSDKTYTAFIALLGRPNVGKSTLLNAILQKKISITSRKPQTTRQTITGIRTQGKYQYLFVDTPGLHQQAKKRLGRIMNKHALQACSEVDIVLWVIDITKWTQEDDWIEKKCQKMEKPLVLVLNKIDRVPDKNTLLPRITALQERLNPQAIVPISAKRCNGVEQLLKSLQPFMLPSPFYYEEDAVSDRSQRFILCEFLREKIIYFTGKELPYTTAVTLDSMELDKNVWHIAMTIWVERDSQKAIVLGEKGQRMKSIATAARRDMEALLTKKVFLKTWIKVCASWSDNDSLIAEFGIDE